MNWYLEPWKKYAVFSGRSRRREYWTFTLVNYAIAGLLFLPVNIADNSPTFGSASIDGVFVVIAVVGAIFWLATVLPGWAVLVRRLHDTGKSGWWVFIGLVPFGSLVILVFTLLDSEPDNGYGPNPKAPANNPPASITQGEAAGPMPATGVSAASGHPLPAPPSTPDSAESEARVGGEAQTELQASLVESGVHKHTRTLAWIVLLLVVVAVVSVAAVVIATNRAHTETGGGASGLSTPVATSTTGPTSKTLLKQYLRQDVLPLLSWEMDYASKMRADKTPPGATVIGAHRMTKPEPNEVTYWGKGKAEAQAVEEVSVELASITPPRALRQAHQKLVRVFRLEADRWYAFTACQRKTHTDAFWPEYLRWKSKSNKMLKTQQQLLADWYFRVRVEADKESVAIPGRVESFVDATRTLTQ